MWNNFRLPCHFEDENIAAHAFLSLASFLTFRERQLDIMVCVLLAEELCDYVAMQLL